MKYFFAFLKKEFRHILWDKRTLLILFGMPIAQVMIFGFALNNEIRDAGVLIWDLSGDTETRDIRQEIETSDYFHIESEVHSQEEAEALFRKNAARVVVMFPDHYAEKLARGERPVIRIAADASDPNQAQVLVSYLSGILQAHFLEKQKSAVLQPIVIPVQRMVYNPELKSVYMFVPGVMGMILLLVSAMLTSLTIAREKESGTMELLLASPLQSHHIIFGKVAPYWLLSFLNAVIVVLLGIFVLGMPMVGSVALLAAASLLFSFTALSLGVFISSRSGTQMTAMFFSMFALLMPTMLLSGFIFPIENMPLPLRVISHMIPARWFIEIIKGVMIKGSGFMLLWKPFLALGILTSLFVFLGVKNIKPRLS